MSSSDQILPLPESEILGKENPVFEIQDSRSTQPLFLPFSSIRSLCLDHHSVIANFFRNAILMRSDDPSQVDHSIHREDVKQILNHEKHDLFDYADLDRIQDRFVAWRDRHLLNPITLHAHGSTDKGDPIDATWRGLTRYESDRNIAPLSEALNHYHGKGLMLTLTVDHSRTLYDAWTGISKRWHIFLTRLVTEIRIDARQSYEKMLKMGVPEKQLRSLKSRMRLRQADLHYFWVIEAQENGYPHIHAVFLGLEWLFWSGNKEAWSKDGVHSKNLKHFWQWGSIYINSTKEGEEVHNAVNYVMKYIRKTFDPYSDDPKKTLTQAMLWAFHKRSFNRSRNLFEFLGYKKPEKSHRLTLVSLNHYEFLRGQKTPVKRVIPASTDKYEWACHEVSPSPKILVNGQWLINPACFDEDGKRLHVRHIEKDFEFLKYPRRSDFLNT